MYIKAKKERDLDKLILRYIALARLKIITKILRD